MVLPYNRSCQWIGIIHSLQRIKSDRAKKGCALPIWNSSWKGCVDHNFNGLRNQKQIRLGAGLEESV